MPLTYAPLHQKSWLHVACNLPVKADPCTWKTNVSRIDVHTWNVAGKPPPDDLDLDGWINTSNPADIYVFG